jgi:hypothetical protein
MTEVRRGLLMPKANNWMVLVQMMEPI